MSTKSPVKKAAKRQNKTKQEIVGDMQFQAKVAHLKEVVRKLFPELDKQETIYDAQTVVNALSGFISAHLEQKMKEVKLSDIVIDLSKEDDSKIKSAIENIVAMFPDESAAELSENLERLGTVFSKYAADKFLKQPMSNLTVDDIVSK